MRRGQRAVHHQLDHLAPVQSQYETQVRLFPARLDDLHHLGKGYRRDQKMVYVQHLRVVTEQHAFDPLYTDQHIRTSRRNEYGSCKLLSLHDALPI